MVASDRAFNNSFLVVTGLTALLFLAGIILLPGLGTYTDEVRAQARSAEDEAPAVTHNTWTSGAPMPTPLAFSTAAVLMNEIYVVGGNNGSGQVADVQIYNPVTNAWSTGPSYPTGIASASSAVVKNILYVFGG